MSNRLHKNMLKIFFMMRMLRLWLNMNIKTFQFRAFVVALVALVVALVAFVVSLVVALVIEQNSTLRAILHIYLVFLPFKSTFQFITSFHM